MTKWVGVKFQYKKVMLLCSMFFLFTVLCIPVWSETEVPLNLPKMEGSKSFDLEISQINREAIKNYQMDLFSKAVKQFKKAEQYYSLLLESGDDSIDQNEIKRKIKLIKNG